MSALSVRCFLVTNQETGDQTAIRVKYFEEAKEFAQLWFDTDNIKVERAGTFKLKQDNITIHRATILNGLRILAEEAATQ